MPDVSLEVVAAPFRISLNPKSPVQSGMLKELVTIEGYEPGTWRTFADLLRPGDAVIDVGAHIGVFTCLAASLVGRTGHVFAFEPDTDNRRRLTQNVRQNGFEWQTIIDKRLVADVSDRLSFYRNADNDGGHALYNPGRGRANVKTREQPRQRILPSTTLDDAIPSDRPIRLLKIDVEGAEASVIRGAHRILTNAKPAIIAEINAFGLEQMGDSELTLRVLLREYGYTEYVIQDSTPFRIPLQPDQTAQQRVIWNGALALPVFNMLFLHPSASP